MLITTYAETGQAWRRQARRKNEADAIALRLYVTPELIAGADEDGAVLVYLYPAENAAERYGSRPPDLLAYVKAPPIDTAALVATSEITEPEEDHDDQHANA